MNITFTRHEKVIICSQISPPEHEFMRVNACACVCVGVGVGVFVLTCLTFDARNVCVSSPKSGKCQTACQSSANVSCCVNENVNLMNEKATT